MKNKKYIIALRKSGLTLGQIVRRTKLPKTTVYHHIKTITLTSSAQRKITKRIKDRIIRFNRSRKGKSRKPISLRLPLVWTKTLVTLCAHLLFDGEITYSSLVYTNRSDALIDTVRTLLAQYIPTDRIHYKKRIDGVQKLFVHNVEVAKIFHGKARELLRHILQLSQIHRQKFLQAFFNDEGSVYWIKAKRLVRGYQHSYQRLKLIQKLLRKEKITAKIDKKYQEIVISRRKNLENFQRKINFSPGVSINPLRSNSTWKRPFEKRKILAMALASYKK